MTRDEITPDLLRSLIKYNPDTGKLTWLPRPVEMFRGGGRNSSESCCVRWNARWAGNEALSSPDADGYLCGFIFRLAFKAHRVAWALHYGEWPAQQVDHVNGVKSDNRIANLRDVSNAENSRNMKIDRRNKSGATGVQMRSAGLWRAYIRVDGRYIHLGNFSTFEDARASREAADKAYGFHQNHGRACQ